MASFSSIDSHIAAAKLQDGTAHAIHKNEKRKSAGAAEHGAVPGHGAHTFAREAAGGCAGVAACGVIMTHWRRLQVCGQEG